MSSFQGVRWPPELRLKRTVPGPCLHPWAGLGPPELSSIGPNSCVSTSFPNIKPSAVSGTLVALAVGLGSSEVDGPPASLLSSLAPAQAHTCQVRPPTPPPRNPSRLVSKTPSRPELKAKLFSKEFMTNTIIPFNAGMFYLPAQ